MQHGLAIDVVRVLDAEVPSLRVHRIDQTYQRLATDAHGVARWGYSDPIHGSFQLTVDADGVVIDYQDFARRVR